MKEKSESPSGRRAQLRQTRRFEFDPQTRKGDSVESGLTLRCRSVPSGRKFFHSIFTPLRGDCRAVLRKLLNTLDLNSPT